MKPATPKPRRIMPMPCPVKTPGEREPRIEKKQCLKVVCRRPQGRGKKVCSRCQVDVAFVPSTASNIEQLPAISSNLHSHPSPSRSGLNKLPLPQTLIIIKAHKSSRIIKRHIHDLKPPSDLILHEMRGALIPLIGVLVVDGSVVFLRVLAAFEHELHKGVELGVGVLGVVHMMGSLSSISEYVLARNEAGMTYPVPFLQHHSR